MSDDQFLTRAQVAGLLQVTPQKFLAMRDALQAKGFPAPAFGTRQGERWDPLAIKAWRRRQIPAEPVITGGDAPITIDLELDRRAEQLARGEKIH